MGPARRPAFGGGVYGPLHSEKEWQRNEIHKVFRIARLPRATATGPRPDGGFVVNLHDDHLSVTWVTPTGLHDDDEVAALTKRKLTECEAALEEARCVAVWDDDDALLVYY